MTSFRYWLALHPDVDRPIGGVKQMHRLAEAISSTGRQAILIQDSADFHPGWFSSDVNTISFSNWKSKVKSFTDNDLIIVPETFYPALNKYAPFLSKIIFNQNFSYTFGSNAQSKQASSPANVLDFYCSNQLAHLLCVSDSDYLLAVNGFGLPSSKVNRIINSVDPSIFYPGLKKEKYIAFMPRKNSHDAKVVSSLLRRHPQFSGWKFLSIQNRTQSQVSRILQSSLIFLSFGHPEGFGLPVAEAMACGCYVIGYSGIGGKELFDLARRFDMSFEVPFGNWLSFVEGFGHFSLLMADDYIGLCNSLLKVSKEIRSVYSYDAMIASVQTALSSIESSI